MDPDPKRSRSVALRRSAGIAFCAGSLIFTTGPALAKDHPEDLQLPASFFQQKAKVTRSRQTVEISTRTALRRTGAGINPFMQGVDEYLTATLDRAGTTRIVLHVRINYTVTPPERVGDIVVDTDGRRTAMQREEQGSTTACPVSRAPAAGGMQWVSGAGFCYSYVNAHAELDEATVRAVVAHAHSRGDRPALRYHAEGVAQDGAKQFLVAELDGLLAAIVAVRR